MDISVDCDPISLESHPSTSSGRITEYVVSDDGTLLSPPIHPEYVNTTITPKRRKKSDKLAEDAATALQNISNALEKEQEKPQDYLALSFSQRINGIKNKRRKLVLINQIENLIFKQNWKILTNNVEVT